MKKKLYLNTGVSAVYQICSVVLGLVIPRLILRQFGSDVNGLVTSITQLLSVISLMDLGVGAVVQSSLYKPLTQRDWKKVSIIYSSASKFFKAIAKILLIYIFILCLYYGAFKSDAYEWPFTVSLVLVLSLNFFAQYYFGMCNTLLLNADQRIYIVTVVNLLGLIFNAAFTIVLLYFNASIQIVKLASSAVFFLKPIILMFYVRHNYPLIKIKKPPKDAIPEKWSGLVQHFATNFSNSIDNVLLTLFGDFIMISIYNVYVLPLISIRTLVETISNSFKSFFGTLIAKNDKTLIVEFSKYETIMHFATSVVMSTCSVVLMPFVLVYTNGVNDADYSNYLFSIIITLVYTIYILRMIYTNIIFAAGKFKDTQLYCIVECVLNLFISIVLVKPLGIVGVAIGTLISVIYRMFASVYYLKKEVIKRQYSHFFKHLIVDVLCFIFVNAIGTILDTKANNILEWILMAGIIFCISLIVCLIVHTIVYPRQMMLAFSILRNRKR